MSSIEIDPQRDHLITERVKPVYVSPLGSIGNASGLIFLFRRRPIVASSLLLWPVYKAVSLTSPEVAETARYFIVNPINAGLKLTGENIMVYNLVGELAPALIGGVAIGTVIHGLQFISRRWHAEYNDGVRKFTRTDDVIEGTTLDGSNTMTRAKPHKHWLAPQPL